MISSNCEVMGVFWEDCGWKYLVSSLVRWVFGDDVGDDVDDDDRNI